MLIFKKRFYKLHDYITDPTVSHRSSMMMETCAKMTMEAS